MKQLFFITCMIATMALTGIAQKPLTLNLNAGDKWNYEQIQKETFGDEAGTMEVTNTNTVGIVYEVLKSDGATCDIKATFDRIQFYNNSPMGETFFDSQKSEDMNGEMGIKPRKILGSYYVFTIDTKSRKIIAIKERPAKEKLQLSAPKGPEPNMRLFPLTDEQMIKSASKVFGGNISDAAPVAGSSWSVADNGEVYPGVTQVKNTTYKITSIAQDKITVAEESQVSLERSAKPAGSFTGSGTEVVNAATGVLIESKVDVKGTQVMNSPMGEQTRKRSTEISIAVKKLNK